MIGMIGPDCAVMCNLINIYIHKHTHTHTPWKDQCEWHRITRMTGSDCAVTCNLINTHTHTHTHTHTRARILLRRTCPHQGARHQTGTAQVGDIFQRVPTSGGRDGSSTSSVAIIFCFTAGTLIPHASPSLQTGGGACEHPTAPFARPGVYTSASYRGITGSEGQEGANVVGGGIGVGDGNRNGNGDVNGHGDGDGAGTGTGVEVDEGAQDGNGDRNGDENGDGAGTGTGTGTGVGTRRRTPDGNGDGNGDGSEDSSGDGNGDDDNGNENRIGEGGREAKKRKKPQNRCRRRAGNGGDTGGKRKTCRKERVGSVAANPDNIESNKQAGGAAQGIPGSSKNCASRESVFPLSRLIRSFRNKYH